MFERNYFLFKLSKGSKYPKELDYFLMIIKYIFIYFFFKWHGEKELKIFSLRFFIVFVKYRVPNHKINELYEIAKTCEKKLLI